jgi:hypothetical protein
MALNDELLIETWAGVVLTEYQLTRIFEPMMMMHFEGGVGERINFPVLETQVAQNLDDGLSMGQQDIAPRAPELDLDAPIKAWNHIPKDLADVRPDLELVNAYGMALGRDIANGETRRIVAFLSSCGEGTLVDNVVSADLDATSGLGEIVAAAIRELAAGLDEQGVPGQGRWMALHSPQWYSLLSVDGVMRKDFGGQANVQRPGDFIEYADFSIRKVGGATFDQDYTATPYAAAFDAKYSFNTEEIFGVAWHRESWALRRVRSPEVLVDWIPQEDNWKVEARSHMGTACVKEAGIYVLQNM